MTTTDPLIARVVELETERAGLLRQLDALSRRQQHMIDRAMRARTWAERWKERAKAYRDQAGSDRAELNIVLIEIDRLRDQVAALERAEKEEATMTTELNTTGRQPCVCGARPLLTTVEDRGYAMSCLCGAWGVIAATGEAALAAWNAGERGLSPLISEANVTIAIDVLNAYAARARERRGRS